MLEIGDCRDIMRRWIAEGVRVQMCVTSPPYWGLRDYGVGGQLGLEPTPEEYIANMVEVFSLARDLLADDGTLWLNLGDSYTGNASSGGVNGNDGGPAVRISGVPTKRGSWLKPKDLVGIPWRVAFALQAPQYLGRIKRVEDRIWLAAMLDAEGCMFIHRRKAGQHNGQGYYRQNDSFGPGVEIANTSPAVIERVMALVGKGSICSQGPEENARRKQRIYRWNLRTAECRDFVQEVYPYLVAKQQQARIMFHCPPSGERATAAHLALIQLHRKGQSDVDFPEIPSLFRPGWYLRSDVIWSKANPMPESVTDRPTKAHEYVFLLAKRERYYYDADAVRERTGMEATPAEYERAKALTTEAWYQRKTNPFGNGKGGNPYGNISHPLGRNRRSVWTIATQPYSEAHFATFPEALVEPCILAGSRPGDVVFDPFMGSGTVGRVATRLGRPWRGCELNPAYGELAKDRTTVTAGLAL